MRTLELCEIAVAQDEWAMKSVPDRFKANFNDRYNVANYTQENYENYWMSKCMTRAEVKETLTQVLKSWLGNKKRSTKRRVK
jgi:hypothetical protein